MHSVDDGLRALVARGYRFLQLSDREDRICAVIGTYGWAEYYDRIQINDEHDAVATRAVLDSAVEAEEVVWSSSGDAVTAINALLDLPEPGEPGAPGRTGRARSGLWLPTGGPGAVGAG
ncbi:MULTISPECIES: hypothetical protein [Saccharopolyspora]|uniref:Uncharacterized protein n=1 Tax=Saccharopolyspora cebuensis TaxID=418759 RepID=A0ABV4CHK4_9PSEU